jgi:FkbM family methyltransferase
VFDATLSLSSRDAFQTRCRSLASALYVGERTVLCRVMGSFLCYLDGEDAAVAPHLAMDGFWEAWNSVALARHVQPGWRVVDVGANHGYFTLLLAALVGETGHVFALEPNPRLFNLLGRTIRVNGFDDRVTLLPYAAAATDAPADLHVPRGLSGDGSLMARGGESPAAFRVEQRRLDTLIDAPIDFLKIDAEGADYDVLDGAAGLLDGARQPSAILLEHFAPFHDRPSERLTRWLNEGYELHYVGETGDLAPATPADLAAEPRRLWDVWLTRESRAD